jgi:hypothetical protein
MSEEVFRPLELSLTNVTKQFLFNVHLYFVALHESFKFCFKVTPCTLQQFTVMVVKCDLSFMFKATYVTAELMTCRSSSPFNFNTMLLFGVIP